MRHADDGITGGCPSFVGRVRGMPLVRHANNRVIAGVCGGIADFLGWDPTLVP
jgi:hypothetical protein